MKLFLLVFSIECALLIYLVYYSWSYRSYLTFYPRNLSLTTITASKTIPKFIHQTYYQLKLIPRKVYENIREFAPGYDHKVYDDDAIAIFLREHFQPVVLQTFYTLKHGAHKADLFRYCVLYVHGGVYMDIKTELIKPIDSLFFDDCINTVLSKIPDRIHQGVIAAPPGQLIFLSLIDAITKRSVNPPYALFVLEFYRYITWDIEHEPKAGKNIGKRFSYNLLNEDCSSDGSQCSDGLDRYKLCCNIYSNGNREIKTRYSDYPWS